MLTLKTGKNKEAQADGDWPDAFHPAPAQPHHPPEASGASVGPQASLERGRKPQIT